jgi:hypothetical protein
MSVLIPGRGFVDTAATEWHVSDGGTRKGDRRERPMPYIENVDNPNPYGIPKFAVSAD